MLELGAGVGRIADPLAESGHRVVAVDDSAAMLSYVKHAATVLLAGVGLELIDNAAVPTGWLAARRGAA